MNKQVNPAELVPAMQFLRKHKNIYPDDVKARWALNERKRSGLDSAVVRVGKLLFISPSLFNKWMSTNLEG